MTNNKLTGERVQALIKTNEAKYLFATRSMINPRRAAREEEEAGDMLALLYEVRDFRKECPGGVFEIQNIKSDSRALSKRLGDALERNSRQAIELQERRKADSDKRRVTATIRNPDPFGVGGDTVKVIWEERK